MSYAHADEAFVARLIEDLVRAGVAVWWDRELVSGDRWDRVLRSRVDAAAALVVVMSPRSAESRWVRLEVGRARFRRREVCPVLLSGRPFPGLAEIQYEDGSGGKWSASAGLVGRLSAAVRAEPPRPVRAGVLVGGTFPPDVRFVGREGLLLDLEAGLYWGRSVAVEALHGTGGVGKTQLAAQYARRRRADYDLIAWIDAEQPEGVATQLADLAPLVGAPVGDDPDASARLVMSALTRTDLFWLLVFDNAESAVAITAWLPPAGVGHVIVTSRQRGWEQLGSTVDVDVLTRDEAVVLLRLGVPSIHGATAGQIAHELGDLPLALEQAAGYLATAGMSPQDYLRLLRARGEELLDLGVAPTGYHHTLATVWDISRQYLQTASPAGEQLLSLLAALGPEPVPLALFTTHPDLLDGPLAGIASDELAFAGPVDALVTLSLARRSDDGSTLTVHRLLAAAVRHQMTDAARQSVYAAARHLLYGYMPFQISYAPQNLPIWRAMLPHVFAAARAPGTQLQDLDRAAALLGVAATYLAQVGRRAEALRVSEEAVDLYRELVTLNRDAYLPDLAMSVNNHAMRLAEVERRAEALTMTHEGVELGRELVTLNRDAYLSNLAASVNNHAMRLARIGRPAEALTVSQEAVDLRRELVTLNRDAFLPDLAVSVNNHAELLAEVGRRAEALTMSQEGVDLYRELVTLNRDAFLPDLAASVNNHALWLAGVGVGRWAEALTVSQEAVDLRRELVTLDRDAYLPDLAMSVNNHALRLAEVGRRAEALTMSQEGVDLYRELVTLNRDAFLTGLAASVNNHAALLAEVGRRAEALTESQEALDLRRELVTLNRDAYLPDLAASVNNHAALLAGVGRRAEALTMSQEGVDLYRGLVTLNRDAYLPNLAGALLTFALIHHLKAQTSRAVRAAREAESLFSHLAASMPDAFLGRAIQAGQLVRELGEAPDA